MSQRPKWLKSFRGGSLGFLNYEVLTIQNIQRKDLVKEPDLMQTKWFDYRRLHPLQATYFFLKCYEQAYRHFYRRAVDYERAPYVRVIKETDFLQSREKRSFWRLRQLCDMAGMPYDFFMDFALDRHHRMQYDGRVAIPRPAHLAANEELITDAAIAWENRRASALQHACDPYYRVANFKGEQHQIAHENFIIEQIKLRQVPRYTLKICLYDEDLLRVERAVEVFGAGLVSEAIREFESA